MYVSIEWRMDSRSWGSGGHELGRRKGRDERTVELTHSLSSLPHFLPPSPDLQSSQHFQEALTLSSSSSSSSSPNAPSIPPNPRIASLRAQALNHLSRASARPDLNRALMERRTAFLAECFPGLQEEEGVEWETDSEEESGSEEEEEESGEEGDEDEDEQMS